MITPDSAAQDLRPHRRDVAEDLVGTTALCSHDHAFGQDRRREGESRTLWVIALTGLAMVVEVVADALTSLLAIVALLSAKLLGWVWMDPIMGVVGAVLVARWSWGLLRSTSEVLLDHQCTRRAEQVREALERDGQARVADLHVWSVGPGIYSAQIALVSDRPATVAEYRQRLPEAAAIVHSSIEVHGR